MNYKLFHQFLDALGLDTCTLVDIGVRNGVDSRWRLLGNRLVVIGFDADQEECAKLTLSMNINRSVFVPMALSNQAGKVEFHICRNSGNSSCYTPNKFFLNRFPDPDRFDVIETREITANTLDNIFADLPEKRVDFIKIDVQGFEKNVLQGGKNTASNIFGIEVEAMFSELYKGQPLFADIDVLLRELGFSLFDLRPCYWKRTKQPCKGIGQIIFADALYFRDPIASDVIPLNPSAAIAICILYGKFDYAMELAKFFYDKSMYSSRDYDRIQGLLLKLSSAKLSLGKIKGGMRFANFLESIANRLRGGYWFRYDDWKF